MVSDPFTSVEGDVVGSPFDGPCGSFGPPLATTSARFMTMSRIRDEDPPGV
jgi:hypothetical protein